MLLPLQFLLLLPLKIRLLLLLTHLSGRHVLPLVHGSLRRRDILLLPSHVLLLLLLPLQILLLLPLNVLLLTHLSGRHVLPLIHGSLRLRDILLLPPHVLLLLRWLLLLPYLAGSVIPPLVHRRLRRRVLGQDTLRTATDWWLHSPNPAHIHHPNRCNRRRSALSHLLNFGTRKRTPGILCQRSLLPFKWYRSRRRRSSSHHRAAQHVGRRTRGARGRVRA